MNAIKQIPLHHQAHDNWAPSGAVTCDRCGIRAGLDAWIADDYLIDDKEASVSALCPECAHADDANHIEGSWLLAWEA